MVMAPPASDKFVGDVTEKLLDRCLWDFACAKRSAKEAIIAYRRLNKDEGWMVDMWVRVYKKIVATEQVFNSEETGHA